ncbi:MAG: MFS transporter [Actinomycetales bacterium]|nr:MFS transporter [Actinomycetales bacterium]
MPDERTVRVEEPTEPARDPFDGAALPVDPCLVPGDEPDGAPFGADGHPRRWTVLAVLIVSLLIVVLDNTVLNIALPTIQRDLGASLSQLVWSVDSYILAFATLLFTWGALGDRYGRKLVLVIGLVVFAVGSVLSAFATTPERLIAFRVVMGAGGAAVIPVTLAIITVVFPRHERGRAIGVWVGAVGGAMALGPVVGGLLLENPQWFRWLSGNDWGSVFLINIPVIALGLVGVVRVVPETRDPHPRRLDVVGLAASVVGLTSLVYGIVHAGDTKDWSSASVLTPIGAGLVVLAAFVVFERHSSRMSFDVTLFADRGFTVSLASISLTFFALMGLVFTLPFYLQVLRGMSTLPAGLCFLPFAAGQLVAAPRSAALVERYGSRAVMTTGMLGMVATLCVVARTTLSTPVWVLLAEFLAFGVAMGTVAAPGSTVIQNSLPLDKAGAGSAVQSTVRQVLSALGVAVIGTILGNHYADRLAPTLASLPSWFPDSAKDLLSASVATVPPVLDRAAVVGLPADLVDRIRDGAFAAYLDGFQLTTLICAAIILAATILVWVALPRDL